MTRDPQVLIEFRTGQVDVSTASELPSMGCGGECIFVGRTRPETHCRHGTLTALVYEYYEPLARTEIEAIAQEMIDRFSIRAMRVTHSIGKVKINEASVVIAVSTDHRNEAFQACRYLIDNLKDRAPIWKREEWKTGATWVGGNTLIQTTA